MDIGYWLFGHWILVAWTLNLGCVDLNSGCMDIGAC